MEKEDNLGGGDDLNTKVDNLRARIRQSSVLGDSNYDGTNVNRSFRVLQNPNQDHKDSLTADCDSICVSSFVGRTTSKPTVEKPKSGKSTSLNSAFDMPTDVMGMVNSLPSLNDGKPDTLDVEEIAYSSKPKGNDPTPSVSKLFGMEYPDPSSYLHASVEGEGFGLKIQTNDSGNYVNTQAGGVTNESNDPSLNISNDTPIVNSIDINMKPNSYVRAAGASSMVKTKDHVNFRPMVAEKVFDGVNISIPRKVVENAKYGLKQIMMNAKGFFFFKFDTWAGLDAVLEGGPWMIRNSPIILKKWSMNTSLHKDELTRIPIWVKLHDVPIQIFEEDGISLIATYLVNSDADFKELITIVVSTPVVNDNNDGFQQLRNKKRTNKGSLPSNQIPKGVPLSKGFQVGKEFTFNPKVASTGSKGGGTHSEASFKPVLGEDEEEEVENTWDESGIWIFKIHGQALLLLRFPMFSIASWNIRGLNRSPKQKVVRQVVNENNLSVCAILESHVDVAAVFDTCKKNDDRVDVMIMAQTNQSVTEDINADWETRYAKEGNEINIIDGVMICFKEKI
ncbi:zinc knuckle CX2CX4HX4C containing protein [Tanacetum coccineum]